MRPRVPWEHVFDLLTRPDVPIGYTVLDHYLFPIGSESLTLSYRLHYLERGGVIKSLLDKVMHDTVTRSHNLGNGSLALLDKLLRVAKPYVCTVGKTGDLKQVGKGLGLRVKKNLLNESRTHLGDTVRAEQTATDIGRCDAERSGGCEELVDRAVVHLNVKNTRVGIALKHFILGRHIVAKLVKLQYRIVKI